MKKICIILLIFFFCGIAKANNIQITNISVVPSNNTIKFDVSWENSWRSDILNNWDAAYIFFKYNDPISKSWLTLFFNNVNDNIPSGYSKTTAVSNAGVFIYRSVAGSGSNTITNVELGIGSTFTQYTTGAYDIKAFAIEMVYIPTGSFYVGDLASTNAYTQRFIFNTNTTLTDPIATPSTSVSSTTFPNGFNAFYCMKYELSQGGYRDFLNALTYTQQANHMAVSPSVLLSTWILNSANRNHLKIKTSGVNPTTPAVIGCDADGDLIYDEPTDGENIACNFLNWPDQAAYLVWAGLRPLTELEYEKAARGIQIPVAGEYAWGNANIYLTPYLLTNANQNTEIVSNPASAPTGNANYLLTYPAIAIGPMRNGIFATATSNRINSGGSFYGVMELSGNIFERVVTTANAAGRSFITGTPQVSLDVNGYPWNGVTTWPGGSSGRIDGSTNATGLIYRGGSWGTSQLNLRISDRFGGMVTTPEITRLPNFGIRGCVDAP